MDVSQITLKEFLSTPSARRATCLVATIWLVLADFYPRPPRGGRQRRLKLRGDFYIFLSTPSARRATRFPSIAPTAV